MKDVIHFRPRQELDADSNLLGFIQVAKEKLSIFGADLDFDSNTWDVTEWLDLKGHGSHRQRLVFSSLQRVQGNVSLELDDRFRPFAKAYIRYMQGLRPTKLVSQRLAALRVLECALLDGGQPASPCRTNSFILNRACQLIVEKYSVSTAYRIGVQLEMLANFMTLNQLTYTRFKWRTFVARPRDGGRVGREFDQRRKEKLPSPKAFDALSRIFQVVESPKDVAIASVAALLCSAPDRISEILSLRENCEVEQPLGDGKLAYGLRWWPSKDAKPMVKWIVPSMVPVVREALRRVRIVTEPARIAARWYENNPTKLYLPAPLEHLRDQEFLYFSDLKSLFNLAAVAHVNNFCAWHNLKAVSSGARRCVAFSQVEALMLSKLPVGFPFVSEELGLRFSEALFVFRKNEFHDKRATNPLIFEPLNINRVNSELGSRVDHGFSSIFSRFGFTEEDGSPLGVTTHQFRHYLNTAAHAAGMSQLDIAKWSGRSDVRQNQYYDHLTPDELLAIAREAIGDNSKMVGPLAELPAALPISRVEFAQLRMPTGHVTELGVCVHDFTMSPCAHHRDCIQCEDLVCIKGDAGKTARMQYMLQQTTELLRRADEAAEAGFAGSKRWYEHHLLTVERLAQLCAAMDDPAIPNGAVLHLSANKVDHPSSIALRQLKRLGGNE